MITKSPITRQGLNQNIYPKTCDIRKGTVQRTFLRRVLGLEDVKYGELSERTVEFPASFGGGTLSGKVAEVIADGEVLLTDKEGKAVLVQQKLGRGPL